MLGFRLRALIGIGVTVLVLCLATALFAVQYANAYAQCSAVPNSTACADVSTARIAVDGLFVAIAGLLAAAVMAITTGINWRTNPAANTALALRLVEEEDIFQQERARRAELQELNALAMDHLNDLRAHQPAGVADAQVSASDQGMTPGTPGSGLVIEEAPQDPEKETAEQARRRVLAERLRNLARNKPDTVAEVVKTWINQPRPTSRG